MSHTIVITAQGRPDSATAAVVASLSRGGRVTTTSTEGAHDGAPGRLVASEGADLMVVPRSIDGERVADLVESAPCVVAVVPERSAGTEVHLVGIAWDGTIGATHALRWAADLVNRHEARLRILHVLRPGEELTDASAALERVREHLVSWSDTETRVCRGNRAAQLLAEAGDLDVLVMGCSARSHMSVARDVAVAAPCVTVVIPPGVLVLPPA